MDAQSKPSSSASRKRRKGSNFRGRKKQKRLDSIRDRPSAPTSPLNSHLSPPAIIPVNDGGSIRRSSRARKPPVLLDSSPVSSNRKRSSRMGSSSTRRRGGVRASSGSGRIGKRMIGEEGARGGPSVRKTISFEEDVEGGFGEGDRDWGSRLRDRLGKRRGNVSTNTLQFSTLKKSVCITEEGEELNSEVGEKELSGPQKQDADLSGSVRMEALADAFQPLEGTSGFKSPALQLWVRKKRKKKKKKGRQNKSRLDHGDCDAASIGIRNEQSCEKNGKRGNGEETSSKQDSVLLPMNGNARSNEADNDEEHSSESSDKTSDFKKSMTVSESPIGQGYEKQAYLENAEQLCQHEEVGNYMDKNESDHPTHSSEAKAALSFEQFVVVGLQDGTQSNACYVENRASEAQFAIEETNTDAASPSNTLNKTSAAECRRCGLCGRGSDGKSPKMFVHESADSENDISNVPAACEEPNYDMWDGFGDEPEWLGSLLGPIRDRFGVTRIWVHQNCAVWSPEVYFAGLGRLKNVRAALSRGRALKCCRCGRPGATIGCRVDRCPRTYHLPCARADSCIFDHHKFLIACTDHRHFFQPHGHLYLRHIKKLKAKKMKMNMKKMSNEACRKDLEAEERWLENCGEDEEFLKREAKRLNRDIQRIAPIYIGGSSFDNDKLFLGWESIAGLQNVIQCMKEVVILPLLYPEVFSSLGLTPPRGVLLHGYPGTGKTMIVRALIGECSRGNKRIAYFARKGADCLGKYVGDAERQLRLLFQAAEKCQPSIIFFDEIDGLAPRRCRQQDQTHSSVVSTLLSLLDGLKSRGSVIVIGATNRPEALDPALRRPGRFDREIYFPLPSVKDRSAILSLHTRSWPKPISESTLSWIAKYTVGYAGADLQALCMQAAMVALKRNCPLQKLLASAENNFCFGKRPSLPGFIVEERDWLAALATASPPCSRREAGMAANEVVSSALHYHLFHCLLQPLSQLLCCFYLDERIWLPPPLYKTSENIKCAIFSAMEQKNIPSSSWMTHLNDVIKNPDVEQKIERSLSDSGLLISPATVCYDTLNEGNEDSMNNANVYRMNSDVCGPAKFMRKTLGFRVLISGAARSGQQHLAGCLINGFVGHIEIRKLDLATASLEGHGDIISGVTQILSKCHSLRCVLYMPKIDLWAVDEDYDEKASCLDPLKSFRSGGAQIAKKRASRAWDAFVAQVDSVCSSSLIIVATSEMQTNDLPHGVRLFFTSVVFKSNDPAPSEHTVPRFFVQVNGTCELDDLVDMSATKLSHDLILQYIQIIHYGIQCDRPSEATSNEVKFDVQNLAQESCDQESNVVQDTEVLSSAMDIETVFSNIGDSHRDNIQEADADKKHVLTAGIGGTKNVDAPRHDTHLSYLKFPNKVLKGNLAYMIASFGYQILRFPHFAELCWATSTLKGGPFFELNGNWKVWPFNSCVLHANSSDNVANLNSKILMDTKNSGIIRGLMAVGLLAYRSRYTYVSEVCCDVRMVLDLLVGEINAKVFGGKDRLHYQQILSQVAYLDDVVNSWAHAFQRNQMDTLSLLPDSGPVFIKKLSSVSEADDHKQHLIRDDLVPNVPGETSSKENEAVQKQCNQGFSADDNDLALRLDNLYSEVDHSQVPSSAVSFTLNHKFPNEALISEGVCTLESPMICRDSDSNAVQVTKSCVFTKSTLHKSQKIGGNLGLDLNDAISEVGMHVHNPEELVEEADFHLRRKVKLSDTSEITCVYECCARCIHIVCVLTRRILFDSWESSGRCSALDDIHNTVSSCAANLLAAVRRGCHFHQSSINNQQYPFEQLDVQHCSCRTADDILQKKVSFKPNNLRNVELLLKECHCHPRDAEIPERANSGPEIPPKSALRFIFKNNTLLPPASYPNDLTHCNFHNLCMCSLIGVILTTKHRLI